MKQFKSICLNCAKNFWIYKSRIGKEGFYCSRKCRNVGLKGKPNYNL